jgi:GT2 family glycosyltransferase
MTSQQQAKADIIILEWNRPDATIDAIRSALEQTGIERKIWVVDQGSEPANRAKLAAFCDRWPDLVHVHWLDRNVGVAAGRNFATHLGSAPYVVSLDNDATFSDNSCVARAVAYLEEQPRLAAAAFSIVDADSGSEAPYWDYPADYLNSPVQSFEVTRFLGGGHALRRAAFEQVGGYDERLFFGGEERDVAWRMLNRGYRLRMFRDLTVVHRSTRTSKVAWSDRRYYFMVRNALYINHKFGDGALGFMRGAVSFGLRGIRNRLGLAALRGIGAGLSMSLRFSLSDEDRGDYRLSSEVRRYIAETDLKTQETSLQKIRRQLMPLPKV